MRVTGNLCHSDKVTRVSWCDKHISLNINQSTELLNIKHMMMLISVYVLLAACWELLFSYNWKYFSNEKLGYQCFSECFVPERFGLVRSCCVWSPVYKTFLKPPHGYSSWEFKTSTTHIHYTIQEAEISKVFKVSRCRNWVPGYSYKGKKLH